MIKDIYEPNSVEKLREYALHLYIKGFRSP